MSSIEEFRGSWIITNNNLDWPSNNNLSIDYQKQEFINLIDGLKSAGINSVILQVRSTGDSFYPSNFAPWSKYITGTLGKNPGFDPLDFAISSARQRMMEIYAGFSPFRISTDSSFNKDEYMNMLPSGSPLKSHPEWLVTYEGYYWLNLSRPEVRTYVIDTIMEVLKTHYLDGIHLDDCFYPYPKNDADFPDEVEFQSYGSGYGSKSDWRRDNVDKFMRELAFKIRKNNWNTKFGVSPFGIWKNTTTDYDGSTTSGLSSYHDLYCDSVKWVNMEWIDYITPQIYWNMDYRPSSYKELAFWWANKVKNKNVHLYIGQAAYKVGNGTSYGLAWNNSEEIPNQIKFNRNYTSVKGSCFFSAKNILANPLGLKDRLSYDLYKESANVPFMTWKENVPFTIKYQAHVENIGWKNEVSNSMIAGTTGQALRLEAIKIKLDGYVPEGLTIKCRAHIQDIGWQDFVYDGDIAGTIGQALQLEALQIMPEGTDAYKYSVVYQAHVQDIGWQEPVADGETAGTIGQAKRMEAIKISVVRKISVSYRVKIEKLLWWPLMTARENGEVAGTTGQSLRLEGILIYLKNSPKDLNIKYRTHVENLGWQNYVYNGSISGAPDQNVRIEAIQIMLEGTDADKYSVKYQAHVEDIGWQDFVKDGETAGTTGQAKRMEAIRIIVVRKEL